MKHLTLEEFKLLTYKGKRNYAIAIVKKDYDIFYKQFLLLSPKGKRDYAVAKANKGYGISNEQFSLLSPKAKRDYAVAKASTGYHIANWEYQYHLNEEFKKEYVNVLKIQKLISVSNNKTALEKFQTLMKEKYKLNV